MRFVRGAYLPRGDAVADTGCFTARPSTVNVACACIVSPFDVLSGSIGDAVADTRCFTGRPSTVNVACASLVSPLFFPVRRSSEAMPVVNAFGTFPFSSLAFVDVLVIYCATSICCLAFPYDTWRSPSAVVRARRCAHGLAVFLFGRACRSFAAILAPVF